MYYNIQVSNKSGPMYYSHIEKRKSFGCLPWKRFPLKIILYLSNECGILNFNLEETLWANGHPIPDLDTIIKVRYSTMVYIRASSSGAVLYS